MRLKIVGFIVPLAVSILLAPLAADAQQPGKVARIGWLALGFSGPNPFYDALLHSLRDLGYVEGQNLAIEHRWAEGKLDRLPALAADLVRLRVDVIVTPTYPVIQAAKLATRTIPIVMVVVHDPVATGLVASFPRPGGNLTGISCFATELSGKLLQLLKEAVPRINRVALLSNPANPSVFRELEVAARALGVQLQRVEVSDPKDLASAFSAMTKERIDGVIVEHDST